MEKKISAEIYSHLAELYGPETGRETFQRLLGVIDRYSALAEANQGKERFLSQQDALLITYGDQVREAGLPPLHTLAEFSDRYLQGAVNGIHLLPFYPFSSDDGFSVIDFRTVDPALGSWAHIERLGKRFRLMFDAVINHISSQSEWFQGFLQGDPRFQDYFIRVQEGLDLSQVVRPRALPLLTSFQTAAGAQSVWTTFSADQIDLNFENPDVLLEIVDLLLFYVSAGAEFIRLDAIAYLWKEIGTACIHLPRTHHVIQLFRSVLNSVAPQVFLITETNVPHLENISYFGDGTNEAQLVYNFALPPLVLYTLQNTDATVLTHWAAGLALPSSQVTFFNFLASHDGIGVNPVRGILPEAEIARLIERVVAHGGLVSYKHNPDGTQSPYELNISYFDALSDPSAGEPVELQVDRFLAAHAIMFALIGMPGIYFHSLFGSRSWRAGVEATGRNRTINRQKFFRKELEEELNRPDSLRAQVYSGLRRLLAIRAAHPAFHPHGQQRVLELNPAVFAVMRTSPENRETVLCLQNVSGQLQQITFKGGANTLPGYAWHDLITDSEIPDPSAAPLLLHPYQTIWLAPAKPSIKETV